MPDPTRVLNDPQRRVRVPRELDTGRGPGADAALRLLPEYVGLNSDPDSGGQTAVPPAAGLGFSAMGFEGAWARIIATDLVGAGRTLDLRASDPWAEAGRKVLRFHLARTLARVPGVLEGSDTEELHAMRVAARRMRAAWRVFGDGFDREATRSCRDELRELGRLLGAVRDLDVLIEILVTYGAHRSSRQRAGLEPLLAAWRAENELRRLALREMLRSDRLVQFVRDNAELTGTPGIAALPALPHAPGLVRNRAPATIWDAYQNVWAYDPDPQSADLATLHQLRIKAKWLRYTLEFMRELLEPDATVLVRQVVTLQDQLGTQRDHFVAASLGREFAASAELTKSQRAAIASFVDRLDRSVERLRKTVGSAWRPVADPSFRRSLGRAIARL